MKRLIILLLFITGFSVAQNKQIEQSVTKLFNSYVTVANIPGLSVSVSHNNTNVYSHSFGFADINNKVPANDSSLYRIGSITKLFTAAAFIKLIESGALKEQDYISRYVDVPKKIQVIKLGQLAANTSGIRH